MRAGVDVRGEAGGSALLAAAGAGQTDVVRLLLAAGTSPDAAGIPVHRTPLGLAAAKGHSEVIRALLGTGARVDRPSQADADATPLILAAANGHVEAVRLLVEHRADVGARDRNRYTATAHAERAAHPEIVALLRDHGASSTELVAFPLVQAVKDGNLAAVRTLIRAGADVNVRTQGDARPVLVEAARLGHREMVASLVAGSADVNAADASAMTALYMATANSHIAIVEDLIRARADVNQRGWGGATALMQAAAMGRGEIMRLLLAAGANGDNRGAALVRGAAEGRAEIVRVLLATAIDDAAKNRALGEALRAGRGEVAADLLQAGAMANGRDEKGVTPLMWAAWGGDVRAVRSLIAAGAELNDTFTGSVVGDARLLNSHGWTALVSAACNERSAAAVALVEAGADVRVTDTRGRNAMSCASDHGDIEAVRALRAAGVESPVSDQTLAETALRRAAGRGDVERVHALVNAGVPVDAADAYGERALMLAAQHGRIEIVRLLIAAGADVNAKKNDGSNALYMATSWQRREIIAMLRAAGARDEPPAWARR